MDETRYREVSEEVGAVLLPRLYRACLDADRLEQAPRHLGGGDPGSIVRARLKAWEEVRELRERAEELVVGTLVAIVVGMRDAGQAEDRVVAFERDLMLKMVILEMVGCGAADAPRDDILAGFAMWHALPDLPRPKD